MASTSKCPYCGSTVTSDQVACQNCGAPNNQYVAKTQRTIYRPKTIEELQQYCAERGMPLLRMRFFIGEDFKEPKAFGIYRDGGNVVVYKNKADGTRAIRYQGPDEEHGVQELYEKLLDECHSRGIYPDGKPSGQVSRSPSSSKPKQWKDLPAGTKKAIKVCVAIWLVIALLSVAGTLLSHRNDGYYRFSDSDYIYYNYGGDWYYSSPDWSGNSWYETNEPPVSDYSDYSIGNNWDNDWDVGNFRDSSTWDDIRSSDSGSSSYDSWDSGGTDWSSDW